MINLQHRKWQTHNVFWKNLFSSSMCKMTYTEQKVRITSILFLLSCLCSFGSIVCHFRTWRRKINSSLKHAVFYINFRRLAHKYKLMSMQFMQIYSFYPDKNLFRCPKFPFQEMKWRLLLHLPLTLSKQLFCIFQIQQSAKNLQ